LTTVLGYLQLAREIVPRTSTLGEYLLESDGAAKQAAELSRLMLTYVGLGKRRGQPLDLSELIRDLLPAVQAAMPPTVSLSAEPLETAPPVIIDPEDARQVVMNLVTNAWEALGEEEGAVDIAVRLVLDQTLFEGFNPAGAIPANGPWVCIEVGDTGPGMDQVTLEQLFNPFFTTRFTGRGLGMAVTLGIVEASDGAIFVKSAPGGGPQSAFYSPCRLMRNKREWEQPIPPKRDWQKAAHAVKGDRQICLAADDERGVAGTFFSPDPIGRSSCSWCSKR
jgi:two-component system, cell cycle sensor histidine kinase and response regulator CckA